MGWIDKVNQWLLRRLHPWAMERVKTDREGTTLIRADGGSQVIRWSDVQEIAVLKQADGGIPCPIGYFALHIHAVGSTLAIVDETVAGYKELCQEIPRRLEPALSRAFTIAVLHRSPRLATQRLTRVSSRDLLQNSRYLNPVFRSIDPQHPVTPVLEGPPA